MVAFVDGPVRVTVPATSANLGPGFDALGLALELRDELEAEVLPGGGLEVVVEGEGADGGVPLDERHLVVRSMHAAFDLVGERPPGLRLHCRNVVPHARGLGSSSAAIVGGIVLAGALAGGVLDDDAVFRLAADIEGHPDNVAPATYGGFTVSWRDDAWRTARPPARVGAVVYVPPEGVTTEAARGLLPPEVPHADAALTAGRAALLVAALAGADDLLLPATEDRLHQHYREPAMPGSMALVGHLRAEGHAAVISGAGPTVLVLTPPAADVASLLAACPEGWVASSLDISPRGAHVVG